MGVDRLLLKMINETQLKKYCSEDISKIENYEQAVNDKTQTWDCHHRLEIQGQFRNSTALLKRCGMYYHVPASQLIFLTKSEHIRLHNLGNKYGLGNKIMLGRHLSEETKKKMSLSHSGKRGYWSGKHLSEETKKKMSISHSGKHHSNESRKKMSMSRIGKYRGEKNPAFGTHWWNNGTINKHSRECPGQGWVRGRMKTVLKTK